MQIVIVGAGFGGVRLALSLANKKDIDVKLISNQSYFEYHAALYRSATGRSPLEVAIPLADFFAYAKNIEIINDTITSLDAASKQVAGESESKYKYDSLVLSLGNITEFYNIKGLDKYSFGVKNIHEALRLKRHLHEQLLTSESDHDYVVVGAGATGVELSAELTSYMKHVRKNHNIKKKFKINLIEAGSRPMSMMPKEFSNAVLRRLDKLGVKIILETSIKSETVDKIKLPDGFINTRTVVWTAGVKNHPLFYENLKIFSLGKLGRVEVDEYLQAKPDVYVIGDSALTEYSGMAQTAINDAKFVAQDILAKLGKKHRNVYKPKRPIYAIPVGSRWAAVRWGNINIYGRTGWVLRRLADLRLYLTFLPFPKALMVWRYGLIEEEVCDICKK